MSSTTTNDNDTIVTGGNHTGTSADTVAANMDRLIEDGIITAADKHLILWFFGHGRDKAMGLADMGKQIGYSSTTVSRLLAGRYEGNYSDVIAKVRSYKRLADERRRLAQAEFIETSIWHSIRAVCDLALVHQMPSMITGVSQIGKSTALEEYRRRSEYTVRYVRMPAAPGFRGAIEAVADACNVTTRCTTEQLRRRIAKSLDSKTLLIVDELHQLAISAGRNAAMKVMEYIRELMDVSGCGLVVCGTRALDQDLINGELKGWLEQFRERCIKRLELPDRMPDSDILLVAKTYGLPEPDETTMSLVRTWRMNRLCKTIMLAGNLAAKRDQPLSWRHVAAAHNAVSK